MTAPRVLTSLNPVARLPQQLRAFFAWRAAGFVALSANSAAEAEQLVAAGVPSDAIMRVAVEETALAQHGKPIPRIAPLLTRALEDAPGPTLLVNADIFPAFETPEILDDWLALAPALALTRTDCAIVEEPDIGTAPYRNGLDAFVFSASALGAICARLHTGDAAAEMTFGIPGWDFYLGALVRAPAVGGLLMDGTVLLHERHETTYADVRAFTPYLSDMAALGTKGETVEAAAEDFYRTIVADCDSTRDVALALHRAHFRAPKAGPASPTAKLIALDIAQRTPFVAGLVRFDALLALVDRTLSEGASPHALARATNLFDAYRGGRLHAFSRLLCAADLVLRAAQIPLRTTDNVEIPVLEGEEAASRLILAGHFAKALMRGDFSPRLYDALALSCRNDTERMVLSAIARYRADQSARYRADQGARYRADQGVRYPADQGARHPADQGVRHPADQGARHPADQGARDRADQTARDRAGNS